MRLRPLFAQLLKAHLQAQLHRPVKVAVGELTQAVHAGEIARGLDVIGHVDDLVEQRHARPGGRVPADGGIDLIVHPEQVPRHGGAGDGVRQLEVFPFEFVEYYTIFLRQ